MFTIEQWRKDGEYVIRILLDGEPLAIYKLDRKATDEELKQMLDIFAEEIGKAIDDAILYGTERGKKNGQNNTEDSTGHRPMDGGLLRRTR